MPVTPVVNGQVIETADIIGMHADVRSIINNMGRSDLGRFTFNEEQAESIYVAGGTYDTLLGGAPFSVTKIIDHVDLVPADLNTTDMHKILEWDVSSVGANLPPCILLVTADVEVTGWPTEVTAAVQQARPCLCLALSWSITNPDVYIFPGGDLSNQGISRPKPITADEVFPHRPNNQAYHHETVGIAAGYDAREDASISVRKITLWGAICYAGETSAAIGVQSCSIPRATVNLFAIRGS